jgi:hypothetical protein
LRYLSGGPPLLLRGDHDRDAVIIGATHESNLGSGHTKISNVDIGGDVGAPKMPYVQSTI